MVQIKMKTIFIILLVMICAYGIVRDSMVMKKTVQYEFMDFDVNDENVDSRVRLARAVHLLIVGHKPKTFPICSRSNPCGWELYRTPGRKIYGFLLNNCRCNANASCVFHDDDLSTYTFQYRCHENVTSTDKFAPTEDIVENGAVGYGNV